MKRGFGPDKGAEVAEWQTRRIQKTAVTTQKSLFLQGFLHFRPLRQPLKKQAKKSNSAR
jgi:hypothetical protein